MIFIAHLSYQADSGSICLNTFLLMGYPEYLIFDTKILITYKVNSSATRNYYSIKFNIIYLQINAIVNIRF